MPPVDATSQSLRDVLLYTAVFAVLSAVLLAVSYRGPKPLEPAGKLVLKYSRARRIGGWVAVYLANGIGFWLVNVVRAQPRPPWEWLGFTVLALVVSVFGVVEMHRAHVVLDEARLVMRRAWRAPVDIAWEDIANVRYNDMFYWLSFKANDGRRIRISRGIGNFGELLRLVRKKIAGRRFVDSGTSNLIATDLHKGD